MYDNDFYTVHTIKRTQKAHSCSYCEREISASSSCAKHVGSSGGQFFSYYSHLNCETA
jgi:hypothetical protein